MRMPGLLLVPLAMVAFVSAGQARPSAPSTAADDIRELGKSIEQIHPDPFRSVSRKSFESQVSALARRAPTLSEDELLVGAMRIVALLGPRNGHTGLFPGDPGHTRELHLFPLRLYSFTDGLYVVDAADPALVSDRVVAVAGMPIETALARVEPLVPRDNPSNLRGLAPHFLLTAEVLDGLGIVAAMGPPCSPSNGRTGNASTSRSRRSPRRATSRRSRMRSTATTRRSCRMPPRPLYLSGSGREMWTRTLAGGRAVYFGYNAVQAPTPAFLRKLTRLVHAPKVRRVIVDVRLNGGGDNTTYGPLTSLLGSSAVNRRGRLYLLTGRATFSAAANFAAEIDRSTRAIIVGEPTGGGVETYGDTFPVTLPTLGWTVHIAARYHERKKSKNDHRLAVEPDVRIDLTSSQHFAARDPVLQRALRGV